MFNWFGLFQVVVGDPSKQNVLDLLRGMMKLHQANHIPVRLGVIMAVNPDSSVSGLEDAGVAVLNAFNFVTEKSGPLSALSFVVNVSLSYLYTTITSI